MDIKEINQMLDAHTVLNLIGYENSCPTISGQEIRDFCPIHGGDKKQSLAINTLTKTFKCHSCGAHGDLIGLYAQAKRITDIESAKQLDQGFTPSTKIFESNKTITNKPQQKTYTYQDVIDCWNNAKETGADTYFKDKYLPAPPIAKFGKNPKGYDGTMIPRTDIKGNFRGVISLNAKNKTKFIYKANEDEALPCFTQLGILDNQTQEMYIGEGIATVQTPWEATDRQIPGVSAGTWSNILPALKSIKQEYPQIKPIVIIDLDDDGNGLKAARQVQEAFPDATFRAPDFKGLKNNSSEKLKDFNDLVSKCGQTLSIVKDQLKKEFMLPVEITPAQKEQISPEAPINPTEQSSALVGDLEIDIICYIFKKTFNEITDDGFTGDEFEPSLFNGEQKKLGKEIVSTHGKIVEIIKNSWQANEDQKLSVTDLALEAGDLFSEQTHAILKQVEVRETPSAQKIKTRLAKLTENSTLSNIETIFKKLKLGGLLTQSALDLLGNEIEKSRSKTQVIVSDDAFEAEMLKEEETEDQNFLATEFEDLNYLLKGGLKGGKLITFQGKAGAGKSTFMLQMRDYLARQGHPVVFVTMEQTRQELRAISKDRIKQEIRDQKLISDGRYDKQEVKNLCDQEYANLCKNIFTIEGYQHISVQDGRLTFLTLSQIKGYVLNTIQQTGKPPILFIDPFQRLSTGYKELDASEYDKINALVAMIKFFAISLNIPIIVACDVTKDHESNTLGEGGGRGSYMIQHLSDVVITFKESEQDPFEAMFGLNTPSDIKAISVKNKTGKEVQLTRQQKAVLAKINEDSFKKKHNLKINSQIWVSLVVSKNRGYKKFSPLFIFQSGAIFKEVPLWKSIYPPGSED